MTKKSIQIDVVSDVVCPWCYIGKKRLEKAIETVSPELEVKVNFLPFELNPNTPAEGTNQKQYLAAKFGGSDRYQQITSHVSGVAAAEGLSFDFEKQNVMPNTFDLHRLLLLARESGHQPALKEAFMKAYFEQGVDLSDEASIVAVTSAVGLDATTVLEVLKSDKYGSEVRSSQTLSHQRGVSGVPFYIINNKYGVSGAQRSDVFVNVLREVSQEVELAGDSCEVGKDC